MKYIVKICGSKLEKCDFRSVLLNQKGNNSTNNEIKELISKELSALKNGNNSNLIEMNKNLENKINDLEKKLNKEKKELKDEFKKELEKKNEQIKLLKESIDKSIKTSIEAEFKKRDGNLRKNKEIVKNVESFNFSNIISY
jgi:hypothetical protein